MSDVMPRSISDADLLLGLVVAVGDGDVVDDGGLLGAGAPTEPPPEASPPAQLRTPPKPRPTMALPTRSRATKAARRRGSSLDHERTRVPLPFGRDILPDLRHPEKSTGPRSRRSLKRRWTAMTDLISRPPRPPGPPRRPPGRRAAPSRPTPVAAPQSVSLAGVLAALRAAGLGLLAVMVLVLVAWATAADSGASATEA